MKFYKIFFRDKQEQSVDACVLYLVRWTSRHGRYNSDTQPEMRAFPSLDDANDFAGALRDAFALVKHISDTEVIVEKQEQ